MKTMTVMMIVLRKTNFNEKLAQTAKANLSDTHLHAYPSR